MTAPQIGAVIFKKMLILRFDADLLKEETVRKKVLHDG